MDIDMKGLFSEGFYSEIKAAFDRQMALLEETDSAFLREKKAEILEIMDRCTEEERQALTFLYSAMPMSDLVDYPAALFLAYGKHGVYLWKQGPFAGRVPEKIFANYVLHYRVNNEDIADTRGFFHDKIMEAIGDDIWTLAGEEAGSGFEKSSQNAEKNGAESGARSEMENSAKEPGAMYIAAREVNYWCAREATYRSTDSRTQNPRTMYGTAIGRCGEESTLGVTSLRSIGIPARQIYAPLWTHCDDNHAWVEVWCDGEWHFLGACEPEERLDRGWFTGPASRAMLLHSRRFGKDDPEERMVGPRGMAKVLNHLDRYARTTELTVKVVDEDNCPVPGARVNFQVLNHGEFGSIALVHAGKGPEDCGIVKFMTGFGSLYISADAVLADNGCSGETSGNVEKQGCGQKGRKQLYGETFVSLSGLRDGETAECTVVIKDKPDCWEGWKELDFHAPEEGHMHGGPLTPEQESTGVGRLAQAAEYRQAKAQSFYNEREAARALGRFGEEDREELEKILCSAHSNMSEIVRFLEWDAAGWLPSGWEPGRTDRWKLQALKSLREKDYWDTKAEVLIDCSVNALAYAGSVPDEIFFRFLLCPRVSNEMIRPCRVFLDRYLNEEEKDAIRREPGILLEKADKWIREIPEQQYEGLITSSVGCIRSGIGSSHSREVFCVNVYRSLGIPARISFFDDKIEYYDREKNCFVIAGSHLEKNCKLTLREEGSLKFSDWEHYSVEQFQGDGYRRVWLWRKPQDEEEGVLELQLEPGVYRIVTVNRCKNGDQLARTAVFTLESGEEREYTVSLREIPVEGMLTRVPVQDFALNTLDRKSGNLSDFAGNGKALFLWLAVTREPTEHILNELYERREDFSKLEAPVYVVLKSGEDLDNKTLRRTMEALPMIHPLLDEFGENYENLASNVGQQPGKLPLALVLEKGQECIYSDSGYNVGLADMLWRILQ